MVVLRGLGELFLRISIFDPGERQERLRNDPSESQENWKFELWDASGGLRETRNPSNRLAGAKEKDIHFASPPPEQEGGASLRETFPSCQRSQLF